MFETSTADANSSSWGSDVCEPDDMRTAEYLLLTVAIVVLSVTGIAGNLPVLVVYFRGQDNRTTSTFIKVLGMVDLVVCAFIMPYTVIFELYLVRSDVMCRLFEFIRHFSVLASNMTLVAIATERYFAVCQLHKKFTLKMVNCTMIGIVSTSCVLAVPAVFIFSLARRDDWSYVRCTFPHVKSGELICHFTTAIIGPQFARLYQGLLGLAFLLSLVLITVFYSVVYAKLWRRTRSRRKFDHRNENVSRISCNDCDNTTVRNEPNSIEHQIESDTRNSAQSSCPDTNANKRCDNFIRTVSGDDPVLEMTASNVDENGSTGYFSASNTSLASSAEKRRLSMQQRTGKMLFVCTVIYLVTWLPFWLDIFGLTRFFPSRYMFFIGNATNPIVYGVCNPYVRRELLKLLCKCRNRSSAS